MDISQSTFPRLPLLLHEFNGAVLRSEESTPADSLMFYEHGEPFRLSEMKPVFHLSTNDVYKACWDSNSRGKEFDLSFSACQVSKQGTGIWEDVEMEIDAMTYDSPCTRRSHHDAAAQWPTRDKPVSCSVSVSETGQTSVGEGWYETLIEDDFGPVSTLSSTSFEGFNLQDGSSPSLIGLQPHNYHYDSTSPPSLYRSPASTQPMSGLPPITIQSPGSSPSSPASTSSYSSSVLTSLSSCLPTPPTLVLLPELHQPRPARPIPIIPLYNIATACEKAHISLPKINSGFLASRRSFGT